MRLFSGIALGSLVALILLGIAVELWLAPLRPHGSWLVLKVIPLLCAVPGNLRRNLYTMQWTSMLVLLYAAAGLIGTLVGHGASATWSGVEGVLALVYFASALAYLHPHKRLAQATKAALARAAAAPE